jgi:glucose/mannose-6-phosphate isomerase
MLDDSNFITSKDPDSALTVAAGQWEQTRFDALVVGELPVGVPNNIVVSGMGGSALGALLARTVYTEIAVPFEISRGYHAPRYVGADTLFIASSYSGNTEETLSSYQEAVGRGARVAVIASGGKLIKQAQRAGLPYIELPSGLQPRMGVIYSFRALTKLLIGAGVLQPNRLDEIAATSEFLRTETAGWLPSVETIHNAAKTIAHYAVGKTPVIYGGPLTAAAAYKWKISFNENAKNVAFWNEYSEFNHNEFIGWTSHPIEKPFAIFDLRSPLEDAQINKRFDLSDKLLSGKRPKARPIHLKGETLLEQLLWASILADFVTMYVALLNGVNPVPVVLIEKLKSQL